MIEKAYLTGCDKNTFWQLEWFVQNLKAHTRIPLYIADFGMTREQLASAARLSHIVGPVMEDRPQKGWFYKPEAMMMNVAEEVCWLDTDCEVLRCPDSIFNYIIKGCLTIAEDKPWTKRRMWNSEWYNTGVMAYCSPRPAIIRQWHDACMTNESLPGDQEVLYSMICRDSLTKLSINKLPSQYNTLRLDIADGTASADPVVMHWTGAKGNEIIKEKIENDA